MSAVPIIRDFDDPDYDPYTASATIAGTGDVADIYPELARLRALGSVHEIDLRVHFGTMADKGLEGLRKFAVLGYDEVMTTMGDTALFSNKMYERNLGLSFGKSITLLDPPEHKNYRMLFQKAFTPAMINGWGTTTIPQAINNVIDTFKENGKAELVSEMALVFPFTFIHDLLKLPVADRTTFQKLAFSQTTVRFDRKHGLEGGRKLREYLTELVAYRRHNPEGDSDFITTLSKAEIDGEALPEEILISFLRQLMNAGGDTSYHGFSTLIGALLMHPEQLDAVRQDRSLIPAAIDEALRWEAPILLSDRTPAKPLTLGGLEMAPGDHVSAVLGAANRDPAIYENPEVFDIRRKRPRPMTFGSGPHVCIGQHLARMEMTTALNLMLNTLPNLRLDPDFPAPQVVGLTTRKPKAVHAVWG
jgi:cytochrome P450